MFSDWLSNLMDFQQNPYALLTVVILLLLLICLLLIIICLVSRCKRKSNLLLLRKKKAQIPTSPSIVGIVNGMPVKTYIRNPDYSPPLPPAIKPLPMPAYPPPPPVLEEVIEEEEDQANEDCESGSEGNSVIGLDNETYEQDREILHYSHILPRYERASASAGPSVISATLPRKLDHPYLQMISTVAPAPRNAMSQKRKSLEDQYEIVAKPYNSYENNNLQVLGFSSLRRDTKSGLLRAVPAVKPPVAPKPPKLPQLEQQLEPQQLQQQQPPGVDSLSQNGSDSGVDSDK